MLRKWIQICLWFFVYNFFISESMLLPWFHICDCDFWFGILCNVKGLQLVEIEIATECVLTSCGTQCLKIQKPSLVQFCITTKEISLLE